MHILATFATLCCQTRWPRNHSCTTQEHVSFFRTFSGTRQKPTGHFRTFSEISTFSTFWRFCSKTEILVRNFAKTIFYVRACSRKHFDKSELCTKTFSCTKQFLQMCKCVNVQMCKCAKTVCAQNAQICSANIFPNAEMHKSANWQICTVHIFVCASFSLCVIFLWRKFSNCEFKNYFYMQTI